MWKQTKSVIYYIGQAIGEGFALIGVVIGEFFVAIFN